MCVAAWGTVSGARAPKTMVIFSSLCLTYFKQGGLEIK